MTPGDSIVGLDFLKRYEYSDEDIIIRRYLRPDKFLDFAQTAELRFASASKMSGDPEEGLFTPADKAYREDRLRHLSDGALNIARSAWDTVARSNARTVLLSCWSMGSEEDARMWEEYGDRSADAVAIETTVYDLRQALGSGFLFVPVRYIDRRQTRLPDSHSLEPFFFKGLRFAWERELRVVCDLQPGSRLETPRRVLVNPQQLRMRFVLAPGASSSRAAEVRGLLSTVTSDSQVCLSRLVS